jgi:hypothetical protein
MAVDVNLDTEKEKKQWIANCLSKKQRLSWNNAKFNHFCKLHDVNSYLKHNTVLVLKRLSEYLQIELAKNTSL